MGVVYQALDPKIDRMIALKVLRQDRMASEEIVRRFLKEAKAIGRLTHPHIVTVYDIGEEEGTVYIAMEFIEGISLAEYCQGRPLDLRDMITIGIQLAETLDFAHQRGVIHRDIKPSNIIVQKDGKIKITDFGIAHIEDTSGTLQTQIGEILGTPAYMSPEQVSGQPVDGRSDIFSLGIILYELSTGQRPFGDRNTGFMLIFNEILKSTPQEPLMVNPSIPKSFSRVIEKALEKEPGKRFQTGNNFAEALKECLNEKIKRTVKASPTPKTKTKFNYAASFGVILIIFILMGGGFYFYSLYQGDSDIIPTKKDSTSTAEKEIDSSSAIQTQRSELEEKNVKASDDEKKETIPSKTAEKSDAKKAEIIPEKIDQQKGPRSSSPAVSERSDVKPSKVADQRRARVERNPQTSSQLSTPKDPTKGPEDSSMANVPVNPVPRFAFLKVDTTPPRAEVYIDGAFKGKTPIILKLDLGQYQIRLKRAGHQEVERLIKLDKMTEYPLMEQLKPLE
jgi:serine/threonine-protein kinase